MEVHRVLWTSWNGKRRSIVDCTVWCHSMENALRTATPEILKSFRSPMLIAWIFHALDDQRAQPRIEWKLSKIFERLQHDRSYRSSTRQGRALYSHPGKPAHVKGVAYLYIIENKSGGFLNRVKDLLVVAG
jgi:hypothetical protein